MQVPDELVAAFELCEIPLDQFHHREHLSVALWYARRYSREEALQRMRTGLQALLHANGKPPAAYCERTTYFWMEFASDFVRQAKKDQSFALLLRDFLHEASLLPHSPLETNKTPQPHELLRE